MFAQGQTMPTLPAERSNPFAFRKRIERIDWKRLASVDVCRVANQMDIDALQENLMSVAFCDITTELDIRYVDTNFIKLFQLAQLLIEYLLYSQDYLSGSVDRLQLQNDTLNKEIECLKRRFETQTDRLTAVRKECHRRRLLLLAQQQLMEAGPQSYHRCAHCPKAFVNVSFLNAHLHRRHIELINGPEKRPNRSEKGDPPVNHSLEDQLREVLNHLKAVKAPASKQPMEAPVVPSVSEIEITNRRLVNELEQERKLQHDTEERYKTWQASVLDQHKADIEALRYMFESELKNLRHENLETLKELADLKKQKVQELSAGFGELEDAQDPMMIKENMQEANRSWASDNPIPPISAIINPNNADLSESWSTHNLTRVPLVDDRNLLPSQHSSSALLYHSEATQTSLQSRHPRPPPKRTNVGIQTTLSINQSPECSSFPTVSAVSSSARAQGLTVEQLIVRTEDEEETDRLRSFHLIPYALGQDQLSSSTQHVQRFEEASQAYREEPRPQTLPSSPPEDRKPPREPDLTSHILAHTRDTLHRQKQSNPDLPPDPTGSVLRYSQLLDQLRSDPLTLQRLRREVELLVSEQLSEHEIKPQERGISSQRLRTRLSRLALERQQLSQKHPSFHQIRSAIALQTDRMARMALHSEAGEQRKRNQLSTSKDGQLPPVGSPQHFSVVDAKSPRTSPSARLEPTRTTSTQPIESLRTRSIASLFEDSAENAIAMPSEQDRVASSRLDLEEFSFDDRPLKRGASVLQPNTPLPNETKSPLECAESSDEWDSSNPLDATESGVKPIAGALELSRRLSSQPDELIVEELDMEDLIEQLGTLPPHKSQRNNQACLFGSSYDGALTSKYDEDEMVSVSSINLGEAADENSLTESPSNFQASNQKGANYSHPLPHEFSARPKTSIGRPKVTIRSPPISSLSQSIPPSGGIGSLGTPDLSGTSQWASLSKGPSAIVINSGAQMSYDPMEDFESD